MSRSALMTKMHAESLLPVQLLRSITNIPPKPTRDYKHISNSLFLHLLLLIMYGIIPHIGHTPLKHHILYLNHANNRRKFYHSMPLHTNTANFAPSSNLQEILSNSPLIIYGIIMYIGHKHHSHILFYA